MKISQIILWLFAVAIGVEIGAGMYETLLVVPLWAKGAPESVMAFYQQNAAHPEFAINAGPRFWMFMTPLVGMLAVATLLSGLKTTPQHRKWRILGTSLAIFVVASTFVWFVPNIIRLTSDTPNMSAADIAVTAKWWVNLNWARVAVYVAGWLCTLKAFSIPQD